MLGVWALFLNENALECKNLGINAQVLSPFVYAPSVWEKFNKICEYLWHSKVIEAFLNDITNPIRQWEPTSKKILDYNGQSKRVNSTYSTRDDYLLEECKINAQLVDW